MKSPLFQKQGLDAFLQQLNDPATTNPDDRTDKEFEHPYGSKGTEPENVKQGAVDPNDPQIISQILRYLKEHRTATTKDIAQTLGVSHEQAYGALQGLRDTGLLGYYQMRWNIKLGAAPALTSPQLRMWDLIQQAGGPLRIKNQFPTAEAAIQHLNQTQNAHLEKLRAKFPGIVPVPSTEINSWASKTYDPKTAATWGLINDIMGRDTPEDMPPPKPSQPRAANICPTCGRGMTRAYTDDGKSTVWVCTYCKFGPKTGTAKPRCPHCDSEDYALMPTDFETAKCDDCGKNWDHGIVPGINDPKTAAGWGKAILPAVALLGLGQPPAASPTVTQPRPAIVQQEVKQHPSDPHMDRLVNAIARAEGAKPERNNPGNIVDFGTGKIKTFDTMAEGDAALREQLKRIADGLNPNFDPKMSLRDAGLVYSNGDPNWAKNVASIMRVSQDVPIGHLIKGTHAKHKRQARAMNVAVILNAPKFAAKNAPDPGQYDEKHEEHVRQEMKQWAQYAEEEDNTEDIKPFDPEGNYLCGDCDMRQGTNECMRVQGPINFEKGSCRLFHEGAPENQLPMAKKFTQAEAKYGESNQGGFGCHRCEYGGEAKTPDMEGREGWCSFWGMHVETNACCAEWDQDDAKDKEAEKENKEVEKARKSSADERVRTPTGDTPIHTDEYPTCVACGETFMQDPRIKSDRCSECRRKGHFGAAKPKCPHCGSGDYGLMPSDFETAKCNDCGKNWNHGIVDGINNPYPKKASKLAPGGKGEDRNGEYEVVAIKGSPGEARKYAEAFFQGKRWEEFEVSALEANNLLALINYADGTLHQRMPALEEKILEGTKDAQEDKGRKRHRRYTDLALEYSNRVIKGRWPEYEAKILAHFTKPPEESTKSTYRTESYEPSRRQDWGYSSYTRDQKFPTKIANYVEQVIQGRWPEMEQILLARYQQFPEAWTKNQNLVDGYLVTLDQAARERHKKTPEAPASEAEADSEDLVNQPMGTRPERNSNTQTPFTKFKNDPNANWAEGEKRLVTRDGGYEDILVNELRTRSTGAEDSQWIKDPEARYVSPENLQKMERPTGEVSYRDRDSKPAYTIWNGIWIGYWGMDRIEKYTDYMLANGQNWDLGIDILELKEDLEDVRGRYTYDKRTVRRQPKAQGATASMKYQSKLLKKKALVDMHESPTMLPPRDDMKRHLDEDVQQEIDDGVDAPVQEGIKVGDGGDDFERGLEMQDEYFNDQVSDAKREAREAFMQDKDMQEDAASWGMTMDEFWQLHGDEYANEYWAGRQASKKAMKAEEGIAVCPKCTSSKVEEVTDDEGSEIRLFECGECAHLFSL